MKYIKYLNLLFLAMLVLVTSCASRDEIFEREQYKTVIAILSDDGFNIFSEELKISEEKIDGYIVASCGGVLPTTDPIEITMVEDGSLLDAYNTSNFDTDVERYAHYLDADRYTIENPKINIAAGERIGKMKIKLRTDGLSPDSTYFIPLKANYSSEYELNQKKASVLFRVLFKNYYATTKSETWYSHRGVRNGANTMIQKRVFPISKNEVRTFAGIKAFENTISAINKWSIRLIVGEDNKVTILPWSTEKYGLKITQIDGDEDYPNVFKVVDDGYKTYKTFLLKYEYNDAEEDKVYQMREELRLEFNEREESN